MSPEPWYGARCIFQHQNLQAKVPGGFVYEERLILVFAASEEEAIEKAEAEAAEYAGSDSTYLGYVDVFHVYETQIGEGTEVFSLMRSSNLMPEEYLNRFFDSGAEHQRRD
jgi:hypothetical protein